MTEIDRTTQIDRATEISWGDAALRLIVAVDADGRTRLVSFGPEDPARRPAPFEIALPLVEIVTAQRSKPSGPRFDHTDLGGDLRYVRHSSTVADGIAALEIELRDPLSTLTVSVRYAMRPGSGTVSSSVRIADDGPEPTVVLFVSSAALDDGSWGVADTRIHLADSDWLAEGRWRSGTFTELGEPDVAMAAHGGARPRGCIALAGRGTWSTGAHVPMGALEAPDGRTLLWQVESNGGWRWQLAQNGGADPLGSAPLGTLGLVASGPGDTDHNWSVRLSDGASFTTPVTTIAVSADGFEGALARLTAHRRADRRPYAGDEGLPLIFNDYMNTLMADPTTEKLLPLIDAAGRAGAEIFVVDAGWYTDEQGWWDTVGGWVASTRRFPGGFDRVMDAIRDAGMTPGLWLEPEVVGVNSPVARELPDAAFYTRHGVRLVDNGRYQLDFRHPAVIERMDGVLDRLIADHGIGYVKFDYNIDPEPGTDQGADSPGAGLYDATAAYLDWIDGLHTRHPRLIVEDCASGGMRADWRTVSHFALLSTSDQQDALRCVPVAASATTLVPPEQAGVWSYPEHGMSPGVATVTLANSVLARPILSGHLDRLDETEFARLREYVAAHKRVRGSLGRLHPTWPIGLPGWEDAWAAAGLVGAEEAYLTVWRRDAASPDVLELPAARLLAGVTGDEPVRIERVFPADSSATVSLDAGTLTIALDAPSAVVLRFSRGL